MTVQLRVREDAPLPSPAPRHRLDWDRDPDLDRFADLSEHERVRVIIRVLCGLVALEEAGGGDRGPTHEAPLEAAPEAPKRRRLLPFLGYERQPAGDGAQDSTLAHHAGLPFLGLDRPMGDTAHPWTRVRT